MNVSLYQAAAAMNAHSRWQEVIAQNLSASAIPGFKKQELSFEAVQSSLPGAGNSASTYVMPRARLATNLEPGDYKPTNVPTDLAIEGSAFFEVQLPSGNFAYTRDGEFHISAQGQLVTKDGHAVMGDSGPLQFDPRDGESLVVAQTGEISQGSDLKGRVKLMDFNDPHLLTPISGGYFQANDPNLDSSPSTTATVRQGYLETANTSAVGEMASLINALRMFEANQKVLQAQDERMGRVISELGSPS